MILELDTKLIDKIDNLSADQLLFLSLLMDKNQRKTIKGIHQIISLIDDTQIQDLINRGFITKETDNKNISYDCTQKLKDIIQKSSSEFKQFYELYPAVVTRNDGTKSFLRSNIKNCEKQYNRIIHGSQAMHEYLMECLNYQLDYLVSCGKLSYMKTMWKWLTTCEWEAIEEQMKVEKNQLETNNTYGTTIL